MEQVNPDKVGTLPSIEKVLLGAYSDDVTRFAMMYLPMEPEWQATLVTDPVVVVREGLASREDLRREIQEQLAQDPAPSVRLRLRNNPCVHPEVRDGLEHDELIAEFIIEKARSGSSSERSYLARAEQLPLEAQLILAEDADPDVLGSLALTKTTVPEAQLKLARTLKCMADRDPRGPDHSTPRKCNWLITYLGCNPALTLEAARELPAASFSHPNGRPLDRVCKLTGMRATELVPHLKGASGTLGEVLDSIQPVQ